MGRIIAVCSQKGGTGKTTTTMNLGAGLAREGKRVLLVDLDGQECLRDSLCAPEPDASIEDVLSGRAQLVDVLMPIGGVTLAPAGEINLLEPELSDVEALKVVLRPVSRDFDFTLIDCPPALGMLTVNALVAADEALVPVQTEYLPLRRLHATLRAIASVKDKWNHRLKVAGILPTMFDRRTTLARDVVGELEKLRKEHRVFEPIPRSVRFAEEAIGGKSIFEYANNSPGAAAYGALVKEVLK